MGHPTPDENTIRSFPERLTKAGAIRRLFERFDEQLRSLGYLAMGVEMVDLSIALFARFRINGSLKRALAAGSLKTLKRILSKFIGDVGSSNLRI